jgi:hypothetical protein
MAGDNVRAGHDVIRRPGVVRASGAQTLLTDEEAEANSAAIATVVKALGGKAGLLETLSVAADQPEVEELVSLLLDPRYETISLRRLCHMAGLTIVDLFAAYKKAMVVKAHLLAYQAITDALLPVVEDVMRRAAPYTIPCYDCHGLGTVTDPTTPDAAPKPCDACAGQGQVLQLPDLDRQKVALELAQLVQKSAGFTLQQNNLTVPPPDPVERRGTLIELQHAVHELLSGPRTPIEAQIVTPQEGDL